MSQELMVEVLLSLQYHELKLKATSNYIKFMSNQVA